MDRIIELLIRILVRFSGLAKPLSKAGIGRYDEWRPGSRIRILLVGYNGARNTGADVRVIEIARQMLEIFGEENIELSVLTMDTDNLKGYFPDCVRLVKINPIFILDLYRECSSHHAAVICEGSTLKSTFADALAMFFCEAAGIMKRQGKPCIAYGTEVGTMVPWLEKLAAKLCSDTYFITRTNASLQRLKAMGLRGHAGTDTAWTFEDPDIEWAVEQLKAGGWDGRQQLTGAAVIDPFCWPVRASFKKWVLSGVTGNSKDQYKMWYFFSRSQKRRKSFLEYISNVAEAVNRYAGEKGSFVVVLGMEALDREAVSLFEQKLQVPFCSFCSADNDAFRMTGVIRCLDQLVTSRYHAAVLSMEKSIPIVSVSMDERLDELMEDAGLDNRFILRTDDPQLSSHVSLGLDVGAVNRQEVRDQISSRVGEYKNMQQEMGTFLKEYLLDNLK